MLEDQVWCCLFSNDWVMLSARYHLDDPPLSFSRLTTTNLLVHRVMFVHRYPVYHHGRYYKARLGKFMYGYISKVRRS